jgi:uncharacterized protein YndB with AHSA1/START domain
MTATMTGRRETRDGREVLVIERRFSAPVEDVWAACTEPERMERWIGTWSGDPASGEVTFRMTAEGDDAPAEVFDVERCEPPHGFRLRSREAAPFHEDGTGPTVHWILEVDLREEAGTTTLTFVQDVLHDELGADMVASVGTGWEYYLDRLMAHVTGHDAGSVDFADYRPGSSYYRELFA